jgi:hypothetical protein
MNRWECDAAEQGIDKNCSCNAVGVGGAVGLRAIGWYVKFQPRLAPIILCPAHRPDGTRCKEVKGPDKCGMCKGNMVANQIAKVIKTLTNE